MVGCLSSPSACSWILNCSQVRLNPHSPVLLRAKLARLAALAQRGTADPEFLAMLRSLDDSHTALEQKWAAMARHVAREADFRYALRLDDLESGF